MPQKVKESLSTLKETMQEYRKNSTEFEDEFGDPDDLQSGAEAICKFLECSEEEILDLSSPSVDDDFPFDLVPEIFDSEHREVNGFFTVNEELIQKTLHEVTGHPGGNFVRGGKLPNGTLFCEWDGANWDGPYIFIKA